MISGNTGNGVWLVGNQNLVAGNLIGTNATGLAALSNGDGIVVWDNYNTIGGESFIGEVMKRVANGETPVGRPGAVLAAQKSANR